MADKLSCKMAILLMYPGEKKKHFLKPLAISIFATWKNI